MDRDVLAQLGLPIVELPHPRARTTGAIGVEWRDGRAIRVSAHRCGLAQLPALASLDALLRLDVGDNQLTQLPALPLSLRELYIHDNQLTALPELPPTLDVLDANRNRLVELRPLADLSFAYLAENQITALPALRGVAYLNVCDNPLVALRLHDPSLRELRAERVGLATVELDLPSLQELSLRGNQLTAFRLNAPRLHALDLRGNALDTLPESLRSLELAKLDLRWNPLRAPPAWLDELRARDCLVYT